MATQAAWLFSSLGSIQVSEALEDFFGFGFRVLGFRGLGFRV